MMYQFKGLNFDSCNLTDGNWSDWSSWSTCDVTCGIGNQTQTRLCDNPAPTIGGKNCSVTNIDYATKTCLNDPCPIGECLFTFQKFPFFQN